MWGEVREIISKNQTAFCLSHHLSKPSKTAGAPSQQDTIREFFHSARGAGAIVKGCDIRIAMRVPENQSFSDGACALELSGYARGRGLLPTIALARIYDSDNEPVGYRRLGGMLVLKNPKYQSIYISLEEEFRSKDVRQHYPDSNSSVTAFLRECIGAGMIAQLGRGHFRKTSENSGQDG
jgi:hypothetical protein